MVHAVTKFRQGGGVEPGTEQWVEGLYSTLNTCLLDLKAFLAPGANHRPWAPRGSRSHLQHALRDLSRARQAMQAKVGEHPTAAQQRQLEALHRAARRMKAEAEAEAKALAKDGAAMLTDLLSATARKGDAKGVWDVIKATGGAGAGKKPNRMTAMVQELVDGTSAKPEHSAIDVLGPRSTWEGRMSVEEAARYAAGIHANYIAGVVREQGEQDPDFDGAEYSRVVREVHRLEVEAEKQVGEDLARQQAVGRTRDSKEGEEAAEGPSTRLNDLFTVDEILGVVQTIKGTSATLGKIGRAHV